MDGEVGEVVTVEAFKDSKYVHITGTSIGKGFKVLLRDGGLLAGRGHMDTQQKDDLDQLDNVQFLEEFLKV